MSSLIKSLQGIVNFLKFRCQRGKITIYIRGYLSATVNALVFFYMTGDFFGNGVMVPKNITEYFFHDVGF